MKRFGILIILLWLCIGILECSTPYTANPERQTFSTNPMPPLAYKMTSTPNNAISTATVTITATQTSTSTTTAIANILAKVSPAIVRVITESGMGSGMIIDKAGYVLTNSHVIEGSNSISVELNSGLKLPASILGRDEINDLAILQIFSDNFPVVILGDSDKVIQGEEVIAIGYPLDLQGSATISRGIVSAVRNESGINYVQTDAAINPGNSGGALINLDGEVIGINTMGIRVAGGTSIEGMNFAIAINSAKPIIPKLIAGISNLNPTPTVVGWI